MKAYLLTALALMASGLGAASFTAVGNIQSAPVTDKGTAMIQVSGTWNGTLVALVSGDSTNLVTATAWTLDGIPSTTITSNGVYRFDVNGAKLVAVRASVMSSGTAVVNLSFGPSTLNSNSTTNSQSLTTAATMLMTLTRTANFYQFVSRSAYSFTTHTATTINLTTMAGASVPTSFIIGGYGPAAGVQWEVNNSATAPSAPFVNYLAASDTAGVKGLNHLVAGQHLHLLAGTGTLSFTGFVSVSADKVP